VTIETWACQIGGFRVVALCWEGSLFWLDGKSVVFVVEGMSFVVGLGYKK
jgi:hypothetical protein